MSEASTPEAGLAQRRRAMRVIAALRDGSNCLEGASLFSAGRASVFRAADEQLDELALTDGTAIRWLKGRYGDGKTHSFARLLELAHKRNWATSYVQITAPGQGVELSRFNEVYAAIVRNCLCPEMVAEEDGQVLPGRRPGFQWILAKWFEALKSQAGATRGDVPTFRLHDVIAQTMTGLQAKWSLSGSFLQALREYAKARAESDQEWVGLLHDWFEGNDVHGRGSDVKKRLRTAGVMESLVKRNAKEMLRSLSVFLRYRGFGGLMIVLDEVENVLLSTPRARREAYITLRELIDNVDYRHGVISTCVFAAGTPDVFDGEKGFSEYEALASRVLLPHGQGSPNPRATVVDLSRFPLDRADFLEMANRIIALYAVARADTPHPQAAEQLVPLLDEELRRNPGMTARAWVRQVVSHLQQLEEAARNQA